MKTQIRKIKFFFQRLLRGWDDSETWDLDETFKEWFLPRFKQYRKLKIGTPFCDEPYEYAVKKWDDILEKIESGLSLDSYSFDPDEEAKIQEAYELLGKYFRCLWW